MAIELARKLSQGLKLEGNANSEYVVHISNFKTKQFTPNMLQIN